MNNLRAFALLALAAVPFGVAARNLTVSPANPVALEFVQVSFVVAGCERVGFAGFETGPNQGDLVIGIRQEGSGLQCDDLAPTVLTLGAFPPGTYRVRIKVGSIDSTPPSYDGETTFTVSAGPSSPVPRDDLPQEDVSGIWTSATEPFTGLALIHSGGVDLQGRANRVTGLWYDYTGAQATWTMLLLDGGSATAYAGPVMRVAPTGTGTARTVTLTTVGNVTLTRIGLTGQWRVAGTLDGRAIDLPIVRFRYTRAGWPGTAPQQ